MQDLFTVFRRSHDWQFVIERPGLGWIEFLPSAFTRDREERRALAAIILNGAVPPMNSGETTVAVSKDRLIGGEKTFRVGDGCNARIRIFSSIFPGKDSAAGNDALRVTLAGPEMHKIAAVA